ncbi:MAG: N-acetylmuramoyl-L-alanine amidase [Cyanobacteria bacterium P01_A01_bin.84]
MKYGIDFGHGCPSDGGAVGLRHEESMIYETGILVIDKLIDLGHSVTRCRPSKTYSLRDSLQKRCWIANNARVDRFVSIHFNAFDGSAHGTEVLYVSSSGKKIATPVVNEIAKLGFVNRGAKFRRDLYVLNNTKAPAILIEGCFVDSRRDIALFDAEKMASAIVKGLTGKLPSNDCTCG